MAIDAPQAPEARADHVHAAITTWLEDEASHAAATKGFHLSPWRVVDGSVGVIDVGVVDDSLVAPLAAGLAANSPDLGSWWDELVGALTSVDPLASVEIEAEVVDHHRRFGAPPGSSLRLGGRGPRFAATVIGVDVLRAERWDDLASLDDPATEFDVRCASPTQFRSGGRPLLEPVATQIFGSWRRAWRTAAPATAPVVDFRSIGLITTDVDGGIERYVAHGMVVDGFVGWALVEAFRAGRDDAVALGRLAALAPYVNVGSNAVVGMGVVIPQPV